MSILPIDVIINILLLLPVKSLLRFRCLSKKLRASIDSPEFIKLHLNRSKETNSNSNLILAAAGSAIHLNYDSKIYLAGMDSLDDAVELDHPLNNSGKSAVIVGSCNGLLALRTCGGNRVLFNPSTKKHKRLPKIVFDSENYDDALDRIGVDGFGYDAATDDYKWVRIIQFVIGQKNVQVIVYSMRNNSWTKIEDLPNDYSFIIGARGALVGGALNWVVIKNFSPYFKASIIAFDLKNEKSFYVPLPDTKNEGVIGYLAVLGGCLSLTSKYGHRYSIWLMKEFGVRESWTQLFSILPEGEIICGKNVKALAYSKSGNEVLLHQNDHYLCWYDLEKQKTESFQFQILGVSQSFDNETVCMESLISLDASNREGRCV